ncbi:hypothetical protein [Methylobacterium soli]|uniref:Uncharacterized protein n=1 Tax=Methylobacterium soli TaxID=553447 RepID=A0A6L3SQV9_9HYPH|nr:hypothetical protein [Methylobacterium soli]KAB1072367.1 hypothetical protein F6X53_28165 [Methylobacterium soli]
MTKRVGLARKTKLFMSGKYVGFSTVDKTHPAHYPDMLVGYARNSTISQNCAPRAGEAPDRGSGADHRRYPDDGRHLLSWDRRWAEQARDPNGAWSVVQVQRVLDVA